MKIGINYNERSWGIDIISHIKQVISSSNRSIKGAGGEQTLKLEGGRLFPDVLLFGDVESALILQGWELKMPDTKIDDTVFFENAQIKAKALGLDSFILWNVSYAHLYILDKETQSYSLSKIWDELSYIKHRKDVKLYDKEWKSLLTSIISYLNDLFDNDTLVGRSFVDAYRSDGITSLIMNNVSDVEKHLEKASNKSSKIKNEIRLWWEFSKQEYIDNKKSMFYVLARANISNWVGKFIFAHILQGKDSRAQIINSINEETTPEKALEIFKKLSEDCNFWTVFSPSVGMTTMPSSTWKQIIQLNSLLSDLRIGEVEQSQLSDILESSVSVSIRKLRGQYPTPAVLAKFLIELCVDNVEEDRILDPCCGSGTIPRVALEQKINANVPAEVASSLVFAGDQDPQAVQITTFAMAKPDLMNIPLRIYLKDAFTLEKDGLLDFRHPQTGESLTEKIDVFDVIASNLPFVAQEGRKRYGNAIDKINSDYKTEKVTLPKNSDISAYLPLSFYPLLKSNGRLGIIITNAWLATAWGNVFFDFITKYYTLKFVITSGAGRWFQNSAVVTNILVLEKREDLERQTAPIKFITLLRPLEDLQGDDSVELLAAKIIGNYVQSDDVSIREVTFETIKKFKKIGLGGNAQFVNCDWVLTLPLKPVTNFFEIRRGERRGWDAMFYPTGNHGIENCYIKSVLKSPKEITHYICNPTREAFSCSKSILELKTLNHTGTLSWIQKFKKVKSGTGKYLPETLKRPKHHWYEMKADNLSDMVMPLNFGDRLFVAKMKVSSFVDQRLICFRTNSNVDIELLHALLNCSISIFFIEGMGFGRGEGVLDLSKDNIEKYMHVLDPNVLSDSSKRKIKKAFNPLLKREILNIADELEQDDRKKFDSIVINEFKLNVTCKTIYDSIKHLVELRQTAKDVFDLDT